MNICAVLSQKSHCPFLLKGGTWVWDQRSANTSVSWDLKFGEKCLGDSQISLPGVGVVSSEADSLFVPLSSKQLKCLGGCQGDENVQVFGGPGLGVVQKGEKHNLPAQKFESATENVQTFKIPQHPKKNRFICAMPLLG